MTNGPLVCVVCQEPGTNFRHVYEVDLIAVAECLGFQAEDNYCESCYSVIEERHANISRPDSVLRSPTVDTMDLGPTQTQSQQGASQPDRRMTRLSERPLSISPPRNSSSSGAGSSQVSSQLDDTVDRLVGKKSRFNKSVLNAIASQSLSLENVSSSQDVTRAGKEQSQRRPVTPGVDIRQQSDDSSLEELQIPPMPKGRRMRPGPKQFGTGRLELPISVKTKVLPDDFARVAGG